MRSAEWIVERPLVNDGISNLANFGNVTFTECQATVNGVIGTIGNFSYTRLIMHEDDIPLVAVSSLNEIRSAFTVNYIETSTVTTLVDCAAVQSCGVFLSSVNPNRKTTRPEIAL
jgi:hypothetical protein